MTFETPEWYINHKTKGSRTTSGYVSESPNGFQKHHLLLVGLRSFQLLWNVPCFHRGPRSHGLSVRCPCFSNTILSQLSLILGPKSILFSCGWGVAWLGFCFVLFMTSAEAGEEKLIYFIILM